MNNVKLILLDMQGTIFKNEFNGIKKDTVNNSWEMIANHLGEKAINFQKEYLKKWNNNEINYIEFMEETAKMHKENNLDYDSYNEIINHVPYRNGFDNFMSKINDKNIKTAIISGGLKLQAERVKKEHNVNHIFTSGEYYWHKNKLNDWNILPTGHKGKILCAKQLISCYNIELNDVLFIGDGNNDIPLMNYITGKTVAIDGSKKLNKVADINIKSQNTKNEYETIYNTIFEQK